MVERIEASCQECGLIFVKQRNNQRYCCEECKIAGRRRKSREYWRAHYAREGQPQKKKALSLAEVNEKARAAGMTYGQYMAKEQGKRIKVRRKGGKKNV